ncbi:MAG TPA: phosphotransferase [Pseudonocardia sp.]|nr:phosphotransferase [Pseudonocardia sp.]
MRPPPDVAATAPELTRVDHLLRAGAVAPDLARVLRVDGPAGACHVLDAKYRPGEQCTVLYAVGRRLVTGRLRLDGTEATPRWWSFPDDPALPGLRVLTDPVRLTGALREALPQRPALRGALATLLRYRPHRRATFLVRAWSGGRHVRYVAKAYHDVRKAEAVYAATRRLGGRLATGGGTVMLADPVAFLPAPRLVLQRVVAGRPLDQFLGDRRGAAAGLPDALDRAAAALAALHAAPQVSGKERPVTAELARFRQRAAAVATVCPSLAEQVLALCAELDRLAPDPPPVHGLVHGDGKPSQFLLRAGGIALLDFDHCGLADPAVDVGTFLAALRHRTVVGAAPPTARLLPAGFLGAYEAAAGSGIADRARWYEAVALVRKALRAFARSPRSPLPAALLATAWPPLLREATPR